MKYIIEPSLVSWDNNKSTLKRLKSKVRNNKRRILTRYYDTNSYTVFNGTDMYKNVINMYDYFQKAVNTPVTDLFLRTSDLFDKSDVKIVGINNNESHIYRGGDLIAIISFIPGYVQLVNAVMWLNTSGNIISKDIYDRRGFKSSTQYYHLDGSIGHQVFYDLDGNTVMEAIQMSINNTNQLTSIKLLGYDGADYIFINEEELWKFFLSEIEQKGMK